MTEPSPEFNRLVRDVPISALRTFFAGVGRLLLAVDQARAAEGTDGGREYQRDPYTAWDRPEHGSAPEQAEPGSANPAGRAEAAGTASADGRAKAAGTAQQNEPAKAPGTAKSAGRAKAARTAQQNEPAKVPGTAKPAGKDKAAAARKSTGKSTGKAAATAAGATAARKPKGDGTMVRARKTRGATTAEAGEARQSAKTTGDGKTMRVGKLGRSGRAPEERRFRSLDATGNVRVLTQQDIIDQEEDLAEGSVRSEQLGPASQATAVNHHAPEAVPPIPGYDALSVPSLRSRLRSLDLGDLRLLLAYEKSNADRDDIVQMFERRIIKLGAAASDAS